MGTPRKSPHGIHGFRLFMGLKVRQERRPNLASLVGSQSKFIKRAIPKGKLQGEV